MTGVCVCVLVIKTVLVQGVPGWILSPQIAVT